MTDTERIAEMEEFIKQHNASVPMKRVFVEGLLGPDGIHFGDLVLSSSYFKDRMVTQDDALQTVVDLKAALDAANAEIERLRQKYERKRRTPGHRKDTP